MNKQQSCYEKHAERARKATSLHEKQRSCYEKYAERIRKTAELYERQLRCTKPFTTNRSPPFVQQSCYR